MSLLRYTGHPFVDVGVAVITVNAGVDSPALVTEASLDRLIHETILPIYMNPAMAGYLSYVVFANARFANPAQINNSQYDAPRRAVLLSLLNLWKPNAAIPAKETPADEGERCVFSGDPAIIRASRMLIPMTTDETNMNFVPEGRPRLPISGWCLLALLAMPLGALNSNGKLWLVHSTDTRLLQHFVATNLERNRRSFQMAGLEKLPNYKFAKTYLLADLVAAYRQLAVNTPLTAYYFTSSAQKSELDILHLPSSTVGFISHAQRHFGDAWDEIVRRAEALPVDKKATGKTEKEEAGKIVYENRNYFYEDLFDLPHRAGYFLRRYLLRMPIPGKPKGDQKRDPRFSYSWARERILISWGLTQLFLERIMGMEKSRIATIRKVGESFAGYIHKTDRRLLKQLLLARSADHILRAVVLAVKESPEMLIKLDEAVSAFFSDEDGETLRPDFYMARDLLIIRIMEQLHTIDEQWVEKNKEYVSEIETELDKTAQG